VLLLALGGISGVLGIAFAIGQHDFKRLLAYSSIENIGIICIGLGLALVGRARGQPTWVALGLGGALLHVWNHSLFKSMLFFTAGSVIHAVHTREMDLLGGLAKSMPRTALCCLIGAASVCALPPLNGFVSELLIYLGLFSSLGIHKGGSYVVAPFAAPALALIGAMAVACFVKAFAIVFLGNSRSQHASHAHESGPAMIGPMLVLAVCCFAIGLFPQIFAPVLDRAVGVWIAGGKPVQSLAVLAPLGWVSCMGWILVGLGLLVGGWLVRSLRTRLVESTGTWGCGYAAPTARMQYTGSSLAELLVNLFAWALRPRVKIAPVEGLFPQPASYASEIHDVVLDDAMLPASHRIADWLYWFRWAQQGSIQVYLVYILVILVLLLSWQLY
jgi:hydrogenase-4 component B